MSKTVLANVKGFTPLIDNITKKHGIIASAIFGRVWRYCQGEQCVCNASLQTIADDLRLSYATVQHYIKLLVESGYLQDMTPELRNHPHTYKDTGKAGLTIEISARENVASARDETASARDNLPSARENLEATRENIASGSRNFIDEDRRGLREEEDSGDNDDDNPPNTKYRALSVAFANASHIPELSGGAPKWNEACQKLLAAGVDVCDVEKAVDEMLEKGYTIVSIASIVNPAISCMSRRLHSRNGGSNGPSLIDQGYTYVGHTPAV